MNQITIFDTPDTKPKRKTGFLNRWHIRRNNKHVALAIPGEHTVHIYPGKYQNVIEYAAFDLSYDEYSFWLDDNNFEEVKP